MLSRRDRRRPTGLSIDGESDVREHACPTCGAMNQTVTSFVLRDGDATCVAKSALEHHDGHVAWIDVAFGSFAAPYADHVSFGCRVGPVAGQDAPAATAVDAATAYADGGVWGHKLTRLEALAHPGLSQFWEVVDHLLEHETAVRRHVFGW